MTNAAQAPAGVLERLGPAEHIIQTCLHFQAHAYHGRPGICAPAPGTPLGVKWSPVSHMVEAVDACPEHGHERKESGACAFCAAHTATRKIVLALPELPEGPPRPKTKRKGKKAKGGNPTAGRPRIGILRADGTIVNEDTGAVLGRYQHPGLFPEACVWLYRAVAEVWRIDNEFAGHWASFAFGDGHEDMKVILAAFMLAQTRRGLPQTEGGQLLFHDLNLRDVGRAMVLLDRPASAANAKDTVKGLNAKLVLRIRKVLRLPEILALNHELGFTHGPRSKALKGWRLAARQWLSQRDLNPRMLQGLVRVGFGDTVRELAESAQYRPGDAAFYRRLRWKQVQAPGGHRKIGIGEALTQAESWEGLDERAICERIEKDRPDWKRIVGMLPAEPGVTRAIMTAAIEAGSLSDKDLIIATPTLEELGLLEVQEVKARWDRARAAATDMRAAHIARNVTTKSVADELQETAESAAKKQMEEAQRDLDIYFMVDTSSSMQGAVEKAIECLPKMIPAFPIERIHAAIFTTQGREITIPHASAAGVRAAFQGIRAEGGTDYGSPLRVLKKYANTQRDALLFYIGDEGHNGQHGGHGGPGVNFADAVRESGINPVAIAHIPVVSPDPRYGRMACVRTTAHLLGIPYFEVDLATFEDAYAIPRTLRTLIASTPVGRVARPEPAPVQKTLIERILETPLLQPPLGI